MSGVCGRSIAVVVFGFCTSLALYCQTQVSQDISNLVNAAPSDADAQSTEELLSPPSAQDNTQEIPAAKLLEFLRSNPDLMVEVKEAIASAMQQQGKPVQPDSLTDDDIYAQIASSREVRIGVTRFLLVRGYISEDEINDEASVARSTAGSADLGNLTSVRDRSTSTELDSLQSANRPGTSAILSDRTATGPPRAQKPEQNITDEPSVLHKPAPYNLLSLRDLYSQTPDSQQNLKRFGSELFTDRGAGRGQSTGITRSGTGALDIPLGPDYVLGPGDELSIALWGGVSQTLTRTVDREGRLSILESGPIQVAGLSMAKAEALVADVLQAQYRNVRVTLSISRLRSIRIFVVGDVRNPGAYEVSALASPINALFAAGGPAGAGSMRILRHFRNETLVGEIDLYDFMLHGVRPGDERLQAGDTLLVPPVGQQVAIFGAVKRPAIYELRDEKELAQVLEDAGGATVAAALTQITIDRVVANEYRQAVTVNAGADESPTALRDRMQATEIKDGDRIKVGAVLPHTERVVYLQGHVARPGRIAFRDTLQIKDVLHGYQDLLPEPADRGEIVRLIAPDLHPETIEFDVPAVLSGSSTISLQPFDTIRIYGRYELDGPTVSIRGEVQKPGTYPLFAGMTAAQLVRAAGGFKRDALVDRADLASYEIADGTRIVVQRRDVAIGDAVLRDRRDADARLNAGDVLTIHQLTGWNDIGSSIEIDGEVAHPGSYGFVQGEHLSEVLRRSGGFLPTSYPGGAVLTRPEVATLEKRSREELIQQLENSSAAARLSPANASESAAAVEVIQKQQDQLLARLRSQPATGRLVINISSDINSWAGTPADIEVRSGDLLRIPKRPGFVLVSGQVYNPSAISYAPGKSAGWYLSHAGGAATTANRKEIFVIRSNGDVIGRRSGGWQGHDVLSTKLNPGDTIVVPQKIIGPSVTWRNLLGTAQVATSLAIAAAVSGL